MLKNKFNLILMIVFLGGITIVGCYFLTANNSPDQSFGLKFPANKFPLTVSNQDLLAYSNLRDSGGIPNGLPVFLKIPIIGVDSAIEDAFITPDGKMDISAGSVNVAWFALGPHPGQKGSAVIGGHYGIQNGVPFVFYNLNKLVIGDKIYIVNDKGETLAFQVRLIKSFDRNADATTVFISNDGLAHLNLITCEGIWNQVDGTYPLRRVVFTDEVLGEGAVKIPVSVPFAVLQKTLRVGAKGADVVALQNFLSQKGFLETLPVADGLFGTKTRAAVLKYQASIGLSQDGVFGPLSRAKFILEQSQMAIKSDFPSTGIIIPESNPTSTTQNIIASFKSLYATPLDGLITVSFLVAIIFMIFKIFIIL
jgi:LPXTG-site transpeptidase (sortase) family protein